MRIKITTCISVLMLLSCACNESVSDPPATAYKHTGDTVAQHTEKPDSAYFQEARLIVPGTGIGQIHLDENTDSVIARLGKPDRSDAAMGKAWLVWTANHETSATHETAVYTARNMGVGKEESRVQEIRITSPFFHTADSLRYGMNITEIKQKLPGVKKLAVQTDAEHAGPIFYDEVSKGISFEINDSGICTAIIVHAKNKALTQVYVPLR